ncbi:unnamed protein product [Mytilus coruscus]|uniref:Uncharacterized protein n=1 Tax=Mytilus coruscus TaxID=42192 RepID=A0A6J8F407_MYTCO|nr:unnamed protein product [Mytilus coruscus]
MEECTDSVEEKYYKVSETALFQLLSVCRECNSQCVPIIEFSIGTMISTSSVCAFGHVYKWKSQNCHERLTWGNLLLASAIMLSGNNTAKIVRLFDQMKLKGISERSVRRLQTEYTSCAVIDEFDSQQADLIPSLQGPDKQIVVCGDGMCDSSGYSAKYGSYTLMDLNTNEILDIQLVQLCELEAELLHIVSICLVDYVEALLKRTFDRRNNLSSIKEALEDFKVVYQRLPPLIASNANFDTEELIRHRTSRFAIN